MGELETLLNNLPPALDIAETEELAWLVVTPETRGKTWTAGYQNGYGGLLRDFVFEGKTPQEALRKLNNHLEAYKVVQGMLQ